MRVAWQKVMLRLVVVIVALALLRTDFCHGRAWFRNPPTSWTNDQVNAMIAEPPSSTEEPPVTPLQVPSLVTHLPSNSASGGLLRPSRLQMLFLGNFGFPSGRAGKFQRPRKIISKRQSGWPGNTLFSGTWRAPGLLSATASEPIFTPDGQPTPKFSRLNNSQLCFISPIACFGRRQLAYHRRSCEPLPITRPDGCQ